MFINESLSLSGNQHSFRKYHFSEKISIYLSGFIFDIEGRSERELIDFLGKLVCHRAPFDFRSLFGSYLVFIHDSEKNEYVVFGDNTGMLKPYYTPHMAGSSFWEIVDHVPDTERSLNLQAIGDFLRFGGVYGGFTFMHGVHRLAREKYLIVTSNHVDILDKNLIPISADPGEEHSVSLKKLFTAMAIASESLAISVDLTAGQDSRVVASLTSYFGSLEEAACSGSADSVDVIKGRAVAEALNIPFHQTTYDYEDVTFDSLEELVTITDGNVDVLWFHRIKALSLDRINRGVQLQLTGIGGELYKASNWSQDFPFFWKRKPNLSKYFNLRLSGYELPTTLIGTALKETSDQTRSRILDYYKGLVSDSNTKTYDNIYYNLFNQVSVSSAMAARNSWIDSYCPLMEPELVRTVFNLPRRRRLFSRWHRAVVSRYGSNAASLPTDLGISLSNKTSDIARELVPLTLRALTLPIKQRIKKKLGIQRRQTTLVNVKALAKLKGSEEIDSLLDDLKKAGLLSADATPNMLPDLLIGRVITIALVIRRGKLVSELS